MFNYKKIKNMNKTVAIKKNDVLVVLLVQKITNVKQDYRK